MTTFVQQHAKFFAVWSLLLILTAATYQTAPLIWWICFSLAAVSAIGNDSIQTLGTFLTSNAKVRWWILWLFIWGIFVLTIFYGYSQGDVAFGRLNKIPEVSSLGFWQAVAPLILILLTRFKAPVSTTFLILAVFATSKTVDAMLVKTFVGYGVAFGVGIIIWSVISKIPYFRTKDLKPSHAKVWRVFQWITTGFLWTQWLMQDTANIIVFLPRWLTLEMTVAVALIGFIVLGALLYHRWWRIQSIVKEKKDVVDVRAATLIDAVLAFVLWYFKSVNDLPMSTTWVFLGLLAGREVMLGILGNPNRKKEYKETLRLVGKDISLAAVGIVVSLVLVALARM